MSKNKVVKDYRYWQIHKEEFDNHFWGLDEGVRHNISSNPRCWEAKNFEQKLERLVEERLGLTIV